MSGNRRRWRIRPRRSRARGRNRCSWRSGFALIWLDEQRNELRDMTKTKIMVIFGFLIAFGAGAVVGIQMQKPSMVIADIPKKPEDRSWLRTELGLTSEQTAQMKAIWDGLHAGGRSH